jgi:hypothetical protein
MTCQGKTRHPKGAAANDRAFKTGETSPAPQPHYQGLRQLSQAVTLKLAQKPDIVLIEQADVFDLVPPHA